MLTLFDASVINFQISSENSAGFKAKSARRLSSISIFPELAQYIRFSRTLLRCIFRQCLAWRILGSNIRLNDLRWNIYLGFRNHMNKCAFDFIL